MKINFGKLFITAVCLNSLLLSFPVLSEDDIKQQALDYAYKELRAVAKDANEQIGLCIKRTSIDAEEIRPQLPPINDKKLQYALAYLAFRYTDKCAKEAEKNVLYTVSSLEQLVERFKVDDDKYTQTIIATKGLFHGISPETAELRIRYYQLSEDVRNKLESIPQLQGTNFDALTLHVELTN